VDIIVIDDIAVLNSEIKSLH